MNKINHSANILSLTSLTKPLLQSALTQNPLAIDATAGNGHDTLFLAESLQELPHPTQTTETTETAKITKITENRHPKHNLHLKQSLPDTKVPQSSHNLPRHPRILAFEPQAIARENTLLRLGNLAPEVELLAFGHEQMTRAAQQFLQQHLAIQQPLLQNQNHLNESSWHQSSPNKISTHSLSAHEISLNNTLSANKVSAHSLSAHEISLQRFGVIMFNLGFLPGSNKEYTTKASTTKEALLAALPLLAKHGLLTVHCYTGQYNDPHELDTVHHILQTLNPKYWRVLSLRQANKLKNMEELWLVERTSSKG